ncbi:centrosomal protein 43 isoform X3 [Eublepharis macularius]|uniref:Centrosomal protein 43 n=1 Tax=Eublepharis macularius TaxID=481883 RepID=A0AA97KT09_EUBMA|nr:centrosomal protein 43 isoform X3 [Eublepharis macularius]
MAAGTEEDTELRDLLVQTLESSGVLNKIKAELRAAVFLALEEQEKVENKTPLVNESLKKFLNTKDGRLVAGLVTEFLQFFNLDFTLAVFQPESSTVKPIKSGIVHSPPKSSDGRFNLPPLPSKIPRYKGHRKKKQCLDTAEQVTEISQSDTSMSSGETKSKGIIHFLPNEAKLVSQQNRDLDAKEKNSPVEEEDDAEEDSFFDDPIPKPEQTYGWKNDSSKEGNIASLSNVPPNRGLNSLIGTSLKEPENANPVLKDVKMVNSKLGSLELGDEDEYADDFNSASQQSEKSEASIGEEIEDISVELEDFNTSDKLEDLTQDFTISQLSGDADYLEDVA